MQNLTWLYMAQNNSVYGISCAYITQTLLCIYTNKLRQQVLIESTICILNIFSASASHQIGTYLYMK